ncbi:alpha-adducin-like, partial [Sinocyclocheilus grahami]|uniref:alpha-adducin-like n=1 Tax=Sinocyclocheilus grahami TaxID=75366 RepID=UPI0007AC6B1F
FVLQGELVTASKAIIEKEYQPCVIVSKTGPNPFNKLTDQELEDYRKEVQLKQKGTEGQTQEAEEERDPGSPVLAEEEAQQQQTFRDESDAAAALRQTLPDLTPDEVSALPAEDPAPEQTDSAPPPEGEEPVAGDDEAGDHGSDESPNKSPSKKKKKFRTPSFLKKNKKKSETQ